MNPEKYLKQRRAETEEHAAASKRADTARCLASQYQQSDFIMDTAWCQEQEVFSK